MESKKNQQGVEDRLREAVRSDRARIQLGRISRFGLMEMSRQRLRPSLGESTHMACPRCSGMGSIRSVESMALAVLRLIGEEVRKDRTTRVVAQLPVDVSTFLINEKREWLHRLESAREIDIVLVPDPNMQTPNYSIRRVRDDEMTLPENAKTSYQMAGTGAGGARLPDPGRQATRRRARGGAADRTARRRRRRPLRRRTASREPPGILGVAPGPLRRHGAQRTGRDARSGAPRRTPAATAAIIATIARTAVAGARTAATASAARATTAIATATGTAIATAIATATATRNASEHPDRPRGGEGRDEAIASASGSRKDARPPQAAQQQPQPQQQPRQEPRQEPQSGEGDPQRRRRRRRGRGGRGRQEGYRPTDTQPITVPGTAMRDSPGQAPPPAARARRTAGDSYSHAVRLRRPHLRRAPFGRRRPDAPKAGSNYTVWSSSPGEGQHFDPKE